MSVLVTGHEGFIGGHLFNRLPNAIGMDKKSDLSTSDFHKLIQVIEKYKPSVICHLGANCSSQISLRDPHLDFIDNVIGTFNVCEAARIYGLPVIFNSTMKIYPGEDGIIVPYGLSKIIGEQYIESFHKIYGMQYIINRPSSVYGPFQEGSEDGGWFTWFVKASVKSQTITLFGDGSQSRDVLYVDDCVDLLVDQINNFDLYKNKSYDFGGGEENVLSLKDLLNKLEYNNVIFGNRLPGDVQHFSNDNIAINAVNGWYPKTNWRIGLERTSEWLKQ